MEKGVSKGKKIYGLSEIEARRRLQEYGYNVLKEKRELTWLNVLLEQLKSNFVLWVLIAASILSWFIGEIVDFIVILLTVIFILALSTIQEFKAEKAIRELKELSVQNARVIRDGKVKRIDARLLVPGDIILLETGYKIPADAEIFDVIGMRIDESMLTGESFPVEKKERDIIYSGTFVVNGRCKAMVKSTGMKTKIGNIAELVTEKDEISLVQNKINKLTKVIVLVTFIICILLFIFGLLYFSNKNALDYSNLSFLTLVIIATLVSAVPEGLPASIAITLALGVRRMAEYNAIIRKMPAVETLGSVTVICTDKTGTLTKNEMTVEKVFVNNQLLDVTGVGYAPVGNFYLGKEKFEKDKLSKELELILQACTLCNDAILNEDKGRWSIMGDPTEGALLTLSAKADKWKADFEEKNPRIGEIVFTTERKMMTTLHKNKEGSIIFVKGAPEVVVRKCSHVSKSGKLDLLRDNEKLEMLKINEKLADGYRVLAIAYKSALKGVIGLNKAETDLIFLGFIAMKDPARPEIKEAVKECRDAGIKVKIITGDNKQTALNIAREIGLCTNCRVVSGDELEKMSEEQLESEIDSITIFARTYPEQKLRIIKALKARQEVVAMTGDGINDAPALKQADIGIAMGLKGTGVAKEVADMVLLDDNFATIVTAIREGRTIFSNLRKFSSFFLASNMAELGVILLGILIFGFESLPLLAVQIILINTLIDDIPAIMLGVEKPSRFIMKSRPFGRREPLIPKHLMMFVLILGACMMAMLLSLYSLELVNGVEKARSVVFGAIVVFGMVTIINFKSTRESILYSGLFSNKWLIGAILFSSLLTLSFIYSPMNKVLDLIPLGINDWLIVLGLGAVVFIGVEVYKFFKRRSEDKK